VLNSVNLSYNDLRAVEVFLPNPVVKSTSLTAFSIIPIIFYIELPASWNYIGILITLLDSAIYPFPP
jgi:hypothetical protein